MRHATLTIQASFLLLGLLAGLLFAVPLHAGEVSVEQASFELHNNRWTVSVTLRHADTGWEHYADAWRVVTAMGEVLGTRTLYHPHVDEQPFTRSLSDVRVPDGVTQVVVEAHDSVHGWSKNRLQVNLNQVKGPGFSVIR